MRRLLQSIIYNRKLYDRPHDEWTCGRAAEGCPCIYGPSASGECRATSQCLPARKGDRWVCTRAISLGAACEPGPGPDGTCGCPVPPCRPVRSLRAQRGRLTWFVASAALGLVLLALWGAGHTTWSNPGPLTRQHALSAQRCTDCHLQAAPVSLDPALRADRLRQHNQLCRQCHDLGPHADSPHGTTAAELLALARAESAGPAAPFLLAAAKRLGPPEILACATCHREHQGPGHDLRRLADNQCQSCHQQQFRSFSAGHPEFTDYPYTRRTRLEFDHVAHFQKHFTDPRSPAAGPTSCAQCHEPAMDGRRMVVKGFDQTCAACHAGQIAGDTRAGAKGLEFFRLPAIDVAALRAAGLPTGEWPDYADGGLTPFMRWLLQGDPAARAALAELGPQDLGDLAKASPARKEAAAKLLWSIKGLFADLVTQGQPVLRQRLGAAAGPSGQFSADVALAAQQAWLPNLLAEVAAYRAGRPLPAPAPAVRAAMAAAAPTAGGPTPADPDDLLADLPGDKGATVSANPAAPAAAAPPAAALELADAEERVAEGGWYRRDETHSLHYRPTGHADPFLHAWLDRTAGAGTPEAQVIFQQLSAGNAPGLCMKCHTVDHVGATTVVNWKTSRPQPEQRPFTVFRHAAHFSLMGEQGCSTCHTLDTKADYARHFGANRDPAVFRSNFAPMAKSTCAACHQPQKAGESCLQCHHYHTGDVQNLHAKAAEFRAAVGVKQ
jgi:hypothetical protein